MTVTKNSWRRWLRLTGLVLGVLSVGGMLFMLWCFVSLGDPWTILLLILIPISIVVVAWKWELIGGLLLIAEGTWFLVFAYFPGFFYLFSWPALVAGVLFLVSW